MGLPSWCPTSNFLWPEKIQTFIVAGVWRDYARQHGAIVIERETYAALSGDRRANDAALWLKPGADAAALRRRRCARCPAAALLEIAGAGRDPRRPRSAIFDRSFAVTYALEAVAVLVGLFGLSSSVGAIVLARRREFGMLRHLGMTRAADRRHARRRRRAARGARRRRRPGARRRHQPGPDPRRQPAVVQLEHGRASCRTGCWLGLSLLLILLSSLTAFLSGREATGIGPVRAVKEDW